MSNPSKQKGTAAETAVVRYAREHGFPLADRLTLSGRYDRGDVLLTVGLIAEVKAGKAAQTASLGQIRAWLAETETERANAGAEHGILVVQRQGHGLTRVGEWECWQPWGFLGEGGNVVAVITMTLYDALTWLRADGWGDPL